MSYSTLLINECLVERWTDGGTDAYGNPTKTWADHLVDESCRLSYPKGRQLQTLTEVVPITEMLFMGDVDVTEHDRVTVDSTLYDILHVAHRQDGIDSHHLELDLQRVIA